MADQEQGHDVPLLEQESDQGDDVPLLYQESDPGDDVPLLEQESDQSDDVPLLYQESDPGSDNSTIIPEQSHSQEQPQLLNVEAAPFTTQEAQGTTTQEHQEAQGTTTQEHQEAQGTATQEHQEGHDQSELPTHEHEYWPNLPVPHDINNGLNPIKQAVRVVTDPSIAEGLTHHGGWSTRQVDRHTQSDPECLVCRHDTQTSNFFCQTCPRT